MEIVCNYYTEGIWERIESIFRCNHILLFIKNGNIVKKMVNKEIKINNLEYNNAYYDNQVPLLFNEQYDFCLYKRWNKVIKRYEVIVLYDWDVVQEVCISIKSEMEEEKDVLNTRFVPCKYQFLLFTVNVCVYCHMYDTHKWVECNLQLNNIKNKDNYMLEGNRLNSSVLLYIMNESMDLSSYEIIQTFNTIWIDDITFKENKNNKDTTYILKPDNVQCLSQVEE
jgi:hypothetical protein